MRQFPCKRQLIPILLDNDPSLITTNTQRLKFLEYAKFLPTLVTKALKPKMPKIPDRPSNGKTLDGEKKILGKYTNFHFSLVLGGEIYIFLQPLALWHALLLASR